VSAPRAVAGERARARGARLPSPFGQPPSAEGLRCDSRARCASGTAFSPAARSARRRLTAVFRIRPPICGPPAATARAARGGAAARPPDRSATTARARRSRRRCPLISSFRHHTPRHINRHSPRPACGPAAAPSRARRALRARRPRASRA
jgi:hypothetical protein